MGGKVRTISLGEEKLELSSKFPKSLDGKAVAVEAEASDHPAAYSRQQRLVAERFALVDIADMHLHHWRGDAADAVAEGYTGVRIASSVEDDAIGGEPHLLELVDELALDVRLEIIYLDERIARAQVFEIVVEGSVPVDVRFALSQEIEVRPVDNDDIHRR